VTVEALASARAVLEGSRGGGGTPTRIVYFRPGAGALSQQVGTISPTEAWGKFAPYRRHYPGLERSGLSFAGDFTYTDAIFWLNLAVKAVASGSVTDTNAYTWAFLPTETSDDLKSALFQFGYVDFLSTWGGSLPGCIVNDLTVTFTKNVGDDETGVSFTAELMSAYGVTQITAFTGSLSDRVITSALGTNWQVYVDASTIGTTADTAVDQLTYHINNGYVYRDGADNTGHAAEIVRANKRMSDVTYRRYFNSKTELDAYIAKTTRKVRSIVAGDIVGATTTKNTIQLDYYGAIDDYTFTTVNGLIYANVKLRPVYDTVLTSDHKWTVINTTASIT
jgi:hypothetical protein